MKVKLIKPISLPVPNKPKVGSVGEVLAVRDKVAGDKATRQYLVKFTGRARPLHCEASEVEIQS